MASVTCDPKRMNSNHAEDGISILSNTQVQATVGKGLENTMRNIQEQTKIEVKSINYLTRAFPSILLAMIWVAFAGRVDK